MPHWMDIFRSEPGRSVYDDRQVGPGFPKPLPRGDDEVNPGIGEPAQAIELGSREAGQRGGTARP